MRIFIAGCGRSGTTLTLQVMRCFADAYVHDYEAPVGQFDKFDRPERHQVVKRTWICHRSLPALPDGIGLIYCVRHPYDTLTSSHQDTRHLRQFHVTQERWSDQYAAWHALRRQQPDRQIFVSRYEELVRTPDAAQKRLAAFFGLTPLRLFSEAPRISIVTTSVEKWKRHPEFCSYLSGLPPRFREKLASFCGEFGYNLPVLLTQPSTGDIVNPSANP